MYTHIKTPGSESRPRKVELTGQGSRINVIRIKNMTTVRIYTHNNEACKTPTETGGYLTNIP